MKLINVDDFGKELSKDLYIIEPDRHGDKRGYFEEYFNAKKYGELGFKPVGQANRSSSSRGVFRGLHFQKDPRCQTKLVEVINGSALDIVVDIRVDSPTYGNWNVVKLTKDNNRQFLVQKGFAHGFLALEDGTEFQYIVDDLYAPKLEGGIAYDDPDIGIDWDRILKENGLTKEELLLSPKDLKHPTLKENKAIFKREQEKYLITGYNGQLGYDIKRELLKNGIKEENILATDLAEMDITNAKQVNEVVTNFIPDVIFHCAAWTAVDKAEEMPEKVNDVNVVGTRNVNNAAMEVGAKIVYLSTDYVFDGTKKDVYQPDDKPNPQSVYGETKYLGEEEIRKNPKHFISRISCVFGINGKNFIRTMLNLAEKHDELNIVDDQVGSPTYTVDLAHFLYELSQTDCYGTYQSPNEGYCSWAEFAEYIFKAKNKNVKVNHVSTEEYLEIAGVKQAQRPKNSKMDTSKIEEIGLEKLPDWQDATNRYLKELDDEAMVLRRFNK